jgi:ribose-phosphate pyrophosphokinase
MAELTVLAMPGNESMAEALAKGLMAERGTVHARSFPDGESYVRIETPVAGKDVALVSTLDRPDGKTLALLFAADAVRDLGARKVYLVAPYLAYLRQDCRFKEGEAVTSVSFGRMISGHFDGVVTVDPHLHRYASLDEICSVPSRVVHAAPFLARWISKNVDAPLVIGPDSESEQWVSEVSRAVDAPFVILNKIRKGDRKVEIAPLTFDRWRGRTPVLVDDIISTAHTMMRAVDLLKRSGAPPAVCLGIHAVFSDQAYGELQARGVARIVTTNTIPHESNDIDVSPLLSRALDSACTAARIVNRCTPE